MPIGQDLEYLIEITRQALQDFQDEVTGSIEDSANAIIDVWEIDCAGSWVVYVKTGLVAAGHALWMLLTPSLEEIMESYLEPKPGRRGGRRGSDRERKRGRSKAGQRRLFFPGGIPDVDNAIADIIPGRDLIASRRVGPGEALFWTTINVADRVLWYWLIVQATETFTTKWISGLLESGECKALNDGAARFSIAPRTSFSQPNLWFNKFTLIGLIEDNLEVINNGDISLNLSTLRATALCIVSSYYTLVNNHDTGTVKLELGSQIWHDIGGGTFELARQETQIVTAGPNETVTIAVDNVTIIEEFHTGRFFQYFDVIENTGNPTLTMTADVAVATRNLHVV